MPRFAAFLRGVNVGRGKRVPMAEFRALLESLGYTGVRTLLNSGNAVFGGRRVSSEVHAGRIREELVARLGMDVPVIVKSAKELAAIVVENGLSAAASDPSRLLVALVTDRASLDSIRPIVAQVRKPEQVHLGQHAVYLWCPAGILESRAAKALLGSAGRAATTRNWSTLSKIHALLQEADA